jgi:hypothetical protein
MRYFNLIPLSNRNAGLLSKLLTYNKINRGLDVFDVHPKGIDKIFKGKLKAHEVDVIRYLNFMGVSNRKIAKYYSVATCTIDKTISKDIFRKHISPFEELINKIHPRINYEMAEFFYKENKTEIDKILISIQ